MKLRILSTAAAILLAISSIISTGSAEAALVTVYEQLPSASSNFISHQVTGGPVLADDFIPVESGSVTSVTWWGSAAASDSWGLTFYTDNNGIPNIDDPNEGGLVQHVPVTATGLDNGRGWWVYTATWSPMDLSLAAGTSYWFSVANFADGWTWALGNPAGPRIGSELYDAVESTGSDCLNGGPHCGPWVSLADTDFAFRINADSSIIPAIPIPAAVWLFGSGLVGLIGLARRKA